MFDVETAEINITSSHFLANTENNPCGLHKKLFKFMRQGKDR